MSFCLEKGKDIEINVYLDDYTEDKRGDIGRFVRANAMRALCEHLTLRKAERFSQVRYKSRIIEFR